MEDLGRETGFSPDAAKRPSSNEAPASVAEGLLAHDQDAAVSRPKEPNGILPSPLGIVRIQTQSPERIIRRPAQPRSNLERFKACRALIDRAEEAVELTGPRRLRIIETVLVDMLPLFKELTGESVIRIEREAP